VNKRPDISIIIVSYNTAPLTLRCLESIKRHCADTPHEVIVVDNASTDDTVDQVKTRFPEVALIANDHNRGFGPANNLGAKVARGAYLFFLNSDTELLENSLAVMKNVLDHRPACAAAGCRLMFPGGGIQPSVANFPSIARIAAGREVVSGVIRRFCPAIAGRITFFLPPEDLTVSRRVDWCIGAALMVRKNAFEAVGGFDPRIFLYAEEMDLCLSLVRAGWKIWFTPETTIIHMEAASSGHALHPERLALIAAGHRYFYFKQNGRLGGVYCAVEVGVSIVKAFIWWTCGMLAPESRRDRFFKKALWHWLYVRNYTAVSY
jgi:GT2 family glycosyltransferase